MKMNQVSKRAAVRLSAVPGTPRWAFVVAWATPMCALASSVWRTAVGLGVPLGWGDAHLRLERIPGFGTFYVIWLSAVSMVTAAFTPAPTPES